MADILNGNFAENKAQLRDHRLIVLFFDLSSMQPEDVDRAVDAAKDYINKKMQAADLVAVVSMSTGVSMDQDFTSDKTLLLNKVGSYNGTEGTGFAMGTTGTSAGTADDASSYVADDTEYNSLNTDRELYAIRDIAKSLERVDQRKSLLYFSGGLTRNGIENQASMRAATNEAVKANMAIYSVDSRGLQAIPPLGDASTGSLRGTASYSGAAMQSNLTSNFNSQEVLATLSSDTGGKAFFDSNDFAPAFQQVQHDTEAYYILGFHSTNTARDGSYRHLKVKVNRPDLKLEYRPGYYAPADFKHAKTEDREVQLTEELRSDLPATDVSVYLQALYFRMEDNRFFVPISLIVPGSQIPFLKNGDRDKATIDVIGNVKNAEGIIVGNVRDTVKLALDAAQQVQRKNIQYSTGFMLAPGRYHVKFVVRENQTGAMGSFETDIQVPDLKKAPLKLSSIVLASQRVPNTDKQDGESAGARWGGVDSECAACVSAGSTSLLSVRGLRSVAEAVGWDAGTDAAGVDAARDGAGAGADQHRVSERRGEGVRDAAGGGECGEYSDARCDRVSVRCGAVGVEAGDVCVPGKRDRRCGRKLQLPADGAADSAGSTGGGGSGAAPATAPRRCRRAAVAPSP